jgi:hypothetical protein
MENFQAAAIASRDIDALEAAIATAKALDLSTAQAQGILNVEKPRREVRNKLSMLFTGGMTDSGNLEQVKSLVQQARSLGIQESSDAQLASCILKPYILKRKVILSDPSNYHTIVKYLLRNS